MSSTFLFSQSSVRLAVVVFFTAIIEACSLAPKKAENSERPLQTSNSLPSERPLEKKTQGLVSWYGKRFRNRRTASGERFNMYALTAAHRTLPFGSKIQIKNLQSGKSVVVRVNDRGPYKGNRLLDVSYGAARALGIIQMGIAKMEIKVLQY